MCLQYAVDSDRDVGPVKIVTGEAGVRQVLSTALESTCLFIAHNGAFDWAVIAGAMPELLPSIWRMMLAGRCRDTMLREQLKAIAQGTYGERRLKKGEFALATLAERYCGMTLDKGADSWRLRYALLADTPVEAWPPEARAYALEDVVALRAVDKAIGFSPTDEAFQCVAAFALQLMSVRGVRVDEKSLAWVETALLTKKDEARANLEAAGLMREGVVDTKALRAAIDDCCKAKGVPIPRTEATSRFPEGQTKKDAETIEAVGQGHPALQSLIDADAASKILSTYIEPMREAGSHPMTCRFNTLVESGRTSSSGGMLQETNPWWPSDAGAAVKGLDVRNGTNLQNWPREEGVRDCIIPREGYYWLSVDYDSLELRTLAQALLWIVGRSTLADNYRDDPDFDPHTKLAARLMDIPYAAALVLKKQGSKKLKSFRQMAKCANFGYPGGMGPHKFVLFARAQYGVELSLDQSTDLRRVWFEAYPEMRDYFKHVTALINGSRVLRQFVSGRLRWLDSGDFCKGSNSYFQGLAADGAKAALIAVTAACYSQPSSKLYGTRPVAFIHDEICAETPIAKADAAASEMVRLMVRSMGKVCPDVPIRATPALSTRWLKAAEPRYSIFDELVPWDL